MDLNTLIAKGYFCEELPPPFNSIDLGNKYLKHLKKPLTGMPFKELPGNSLCVNFSTPKVGIHRRHFSIPNPYPQLKLSESIVDNWDNIVASYSKSTVSIGFPELDPNGKRAIIYLNKFERFKELSIKKSAVSLYELHMDISKYFYSIYTHSIPWAIHTKQAAKADTSSNLWGNDIDRFMRMAQSNQTKGIPVGTDTSRIVAEIIGSDIDEQFVNILNAKNIRHHGLRFVDDCRYFFNTLADAETALKEYNKILTSYSLNLNEEKTEIIKRPCIFDNIWNSQLNSYPLEEKLDKRQRTHLKNYFNILISLSIENPKDSVIKYGIHRILKMDIHTKNVDILEPLLYNITLCETVILPITLEILKKYRPQISTYQISEFIKSMILQNVHKGHHFEVAWALWIAREFEVKIPQDIANLVIESLDVISVLILLDLYHSNKVNGKLDFTELEKELNEDSLYSELWLLAYEAEIKKWLNLNNIQGNKFFKLLEKNNISFYKTDQTNTSTQTENTNLINIEDLIVSEY